MMYPQEHQVVSIDEQLRIDREREARHARLFPARHQRPHQVRPISLWFRLLMSSVIVGLLTLVTVTMYSIGGNVAVAGWLVCLLVVMFSYALIVAGADNE